MKDLEKSNMYGFAKFVIALSRLNNGRVIERHRLPTLMYWAIADYVAQNGVDEYVAGLYDVPFNWSDYGAKLPHIQFELYRDRDTLREDVSLYSGLEFRDYSVMTEYVENYLNDGIFVKGFAMTAKMMESHAHERWKKSWFKEGYEYLITDFEFDYTNQNATKSDKRPKRRSNVVSGELAKEALFADDEYGRYDKYEEQLAQERRELDRLVKEKIAEYDRVEEGNTSFAVEVFNFIDSMWRRFKAVVHEAWYGDEEWEAKSNVKKEVAPTLSRLISEGGVLDIDGNLTLSTEVNHLCKTVRDEILRVSEIDLNEAELLAVKFETTLNRVLNDVNSVESADKAIKILLNVLKYIEVKDYGKEESTDDTALQMELEFTSRAVEEAIKIKGIENGDVTPKTVDQILIEDGYKL